MMLMFQTLLSLVNTYFKSYWKDKFLQITDIK